MKSKIKVKMKFLLILYFFSPAIVMAHHAFSRDYVADEIGTIEGEIIEVFYKNPHARYYIEVDDGQGGKNIWDAQTQNLTMLTRLGWKKDTYQVGDKLTVTGNLGRNGTKRMFIIKVEDENGAVRRPTWVTGDTPQEFTSDSKSSGSWNPAGAQQATGDSTTESATSSEPILVVENQARSADDFLGHWRITSPLLMAAVPGITTNYDISIEKVGVGYRGWAYNGPFEVAFEDNMIVMTVDWTEGSDAQNKSKFIGSITSQGNLFGTIDHGGLVYFTGKPAVNGTFTGIRIDYPESERVAHLPDLPPDEIDISGIWRGDASKFGLNKNKFDLTDTGKRVAENFDVTDAPQLRCAGYGLVSTFIFSNIIFDLEIHQSEEQITILYGADYVRRIYLDDREYPDTRQDTYLGFSKGEWKGNTLVVRTTNIAPSFLRVGHGHPISENAYAIEHYSVDEEENLRAEMWMYDSENYNRPPYFHAIFNKNTSNPVITKHGCDPKSFFRQLHLEGELEEFFSRGADYHR